MLRRARELKSKIENCTKSDKKIANDILEYILEKTYLYNNTRLHNLFENIEKMYPALFNSN